jgi:hypothetical protein
MYKISPAGRNDIGCITKNALTIHIGRAFFIGDYFSSYKAKAVGYTYTN